MIDWLIAMHVFLVIVNVFDEWRVKLWNVLYIFFLSVRSKHILSEDIKISCCVIYRNCSFYLIFYAVPVIVFYLLFILYTQTHTHYVMYSKFTSALLLFYIIVVFYHQLEPSSKNTNISFHYFSSCVHCFYFVVLFLLMSLITVRFIALCLYLCIYVYIYVYEYDVCMFKLFLYQNNTLALSTSSSSSSCVFNIIIIIYWSNIYFHCLSYSTHPRMFNI